MPQIAVLTALLWMTVRATPAQDAKTTAEDALRDGRSEPEFDRLFGRGRLRQLRPEPDDLVRPVVYVDQSILIFRRNCWFSLQMNSINSISGTMR